MTSAVAADASPCTRRPVMHTGAHTRGEDRQSSFLFMISSYSVLQTLVGE